MNGLRFVFAALVYVCLSGPATLLADDPAVWYRDYASAARAAQTEGKKLLIVYTGTDWIEICQKFHDEILTQPSFIGALSGRFVLLKLEYPEDDVIPREEAAEKIFLREAYMVRGYPSIVLTEAGGRPFGLNGYQALGPSEYAAQIRLADAAHEACLTASQQSEPLEGVAKAKRLRLAIPDLPGALMARYYRREMEAILRSDPDDSLGVKDTFVKLISEADYGKKMQQLRGEAKWGEMVEVTEKFIGENKLRGEALQRALFNQATLYRRMEDEKGERLALEKIVSIDAISESALAAKERLEQNRRKHSESEQSESD